MSQDNDILECARTIRPYLQDLLDAGADCIDQALANLLIRSRTGESVEEHIQEVLSQRKQTREWMRRYLAGEEVETGIHKGGYSQLSGTSDAIAAHKYICPEGDYVWYRRSAGQPIPQCPTHCMILKPTTN